MKKRLAIIILLSCLFFHFSYSKNPCRKFIRKANRFLKKHVEDGRVDYERLHKKSESLNKLVKLIGVISPTSCKEKFQKSYYINAYNILVIKTIVGNYPLEFPLETRGLFSSVKHKIGDDTLTLNELEDSIILSRFKDVRILFVLSSASIGSPELASYAYKPRKLEKQFDQQMKKICNNYDYIRVFKKVSLILLAEDFKRSQQGFKKEEIIDSINKYREEPLPTDFIIDFYPVNRRLNIRN